MKRFRLKPLLLAAALTLQLGVPALAADSPNLTYKKSGREAALTLNSLPTGSVYGVQLSMTVPETSYSSVTFTPADSDAYSPDCRLSASSGGTQITIYLTSRSPLNDGATLSLGTLKLDQDFTPPTTATLTMLDRELKPVSSANGISLPVSGSSTGGNGGNSGGSSRPGGSGGGSSSAGTQYAITAAKTEHGSISLSASKSIARETITVTVKPDQRYELDSIKAVTGKDREVTLTQSKTDAGKYTFTMPSGDVEVSATFRRSAEEPVTLPFTDVAQNDWFCDAVKYVYREKMMTGTAETTFSPNATTTRGMIVTVLYRLAGSPQTQLSSFPDVPVDQYYAGPVGWASSNDIVNGYGGAENGSFGPDNPITREQLATILYRYANKMGYDTKARGDLSVFTDREQISAYATDAMSWAVGIGLITGMGDGTVNASGSATRAHVATMLMRFCEKVAEL